MPEFREGETEQEWMARCVPETEAEGNTNERAVAICLSKFENKGDDNVSEEKAMYDEVAENPAVFATSFAELEEIRSAQDMMFNMQKITGDFGMLAQNIMESPMIEDKQAALQDLSNEFADRIETAEETKEYEDITEWLDEKAVWTRAFINDLPDSAFLYIAPGGEKDSEGKTTPKTLRKFPYKDSTGKVDLPHLRNAIVRIPQSNAPGLTAEKKQQLQEKARKILAKETGEKGLLDTIKGWFDDLKSLLIKLEPEPVFEQSVKTFTAKDGKPWIVVWSTNAFKDRDEEMFQTKAIEEFVERHASDDVKGEFWFWHLPASKFADIKLQSVVGRFLVEAGPFDETFVGQAFKDFFERNPNGTKRLAPYGWGASHGFKYKPEDREDGVFEWFEKHESSVLPLDKAANPFNPGFFMSNKEVTLDNETRKIWEEELGTELVEVIVQTGETKTAELEEAGVEFKGEQPETVEEAVETPVEEPVEEEKAEEQPEVVEEVVVEEAVVEEPVEQKAITREEIAEAIKLAMSGLRDELKAETEETIKAEVSETVDSLMEVLMPVIEKVSALAKSDETKIAQAVQDVPTASIASMVKSSLFGEAAKVDGRSKFGRDKPEETEPETKGQYPTVAGVPLRLWGNKEAK